MANHSSCFGESLINIKKEIVIVRLVRRLTPVLITLVIKIKSPLRSMGFLAAYLFSKSLNNWSYYLGQNLQLIVQKIKKKSVQIFVCTDDY